MRKVLLFILFIGGFFTFTYLFFPRVTDTPCVLYNDFVELTINGKVIRKYVDSDQHSYPIVEVQQNDIDTIMRVNLVLERTKIFEEINEFDMLIKAKGSDSISIIHSGQEPIMRKANFGCK